MSSRPFLRFVAVSPLRSVVAALMFGMATAIPAQAANFFFSFDSTQPGTGAFVTTVTSEDFPGAVTFSRLGSNLASSGGATFTDYNGLTWVGSGSANAPGHSLAWDGGSTGNSFTLSFDTTGLQDLQLRFDVRNAGVGANLTSFGAIDYNTGSGFTATGITSPTWLANGVFQTAIIDFSSLGAIENQGAVSLRFSFGAITGSTSFRVDNLQMSAVPEPSTWALMIIGGGWLVLLARRRMMVPSRGLS